VVFCVVMAWTPRRATPTVPTILHDYDVVMLIKINEDMSNITTPGVCGTVGVRQVR
jgi:hypothetical protein